ncbi:uncharacterized protein LOC142329905 [Lycorma delicatula]|uniref:uncharacterized protein LOC142329905 n=1 Tax=Lycorma delicatula TaxID=130591 RepID=UPI003F50DA85
MIWARRTRRRNLNWGNSVEMDTTPVRWSSSERPLSVRTVWVGSVRHAILSLDDPLVQYQGTPYIARSGSLASLESETSSTSYSITDCELEECLVKLRVALDSVEKANLPPIENSSTNSSRRDPSPCTSPSPSGFQQNPLSERVLQWLDLANKGNTKVASLLPKRTKNISTSIKTTHPKRRVTRSAVVVDIPERKPSLLTSKRSSKDSPHLFHRSSPSINEEKSQQNGIETPIVLPQRYEPIRPLTAWSSSGAKPTRPQLHIFIPPLQQTFKTLTTSDCGSNVIE